MVNLTADELKPGMRVAKDIFSKDGAILLNAGIELNTRYIRKLNQLGFESIWILPENQIILEEEESSQQQVNRNRYDSVSLLTHSAANSIIKNIILEVENEGIMDQIKLSQAIEIVDSIIDEIMNNRVIVENLEEYYQPITTIGNMVQELISKENIFATLVNIRSYDEYTFVHSVNVCVMAITIGLALRYERNQLKELGLSALLHDIGKIRVPLEIIRKPGMLNASEREEVEKHSGYAFQILKTIPNIPSAVISAVYQHHERFDGRGYPEKLKGDNINEYAKIIAVVDVYDALITDQCYRPHFKSYEAAEIIWASSGSAFDPRIVKTFMDNIVIYPVGSIVELNNGQRGVVVKINRTMPARPVVCVFYDELGEILSIPRKIDLMNKLTTFITKVFSSDPL